MSGFNLRERPTNGERKITQLLRSNITNIVLSKEPELGSKYQFTSQRGKLEEIARSACIPCPSVFLLYSSSSSRPSSLSEIPHQAVHEEKSINIPQCSLIYSRNSYSIHVSSILFIITSVDFCTFVPAIIDMRVEIVHLRGNKICQQMYAECTGFPKEMSHK